MEPVNFRSITPLHYFQLDQHSADFSHSGEFGDGTYRIRVTKYEPGTSEHADLMECAEQIRGHRVIMPVYIESPPTHGLIVDLSQPLSDESLVYPEELLDITRAILTALRLHASGGLRCHATFFTRSPPDPLFGKHVGTILPNNQRLISPSILGKMSELPTTVF